MLPEVAYYGVPVILDVPGIGFVEVSEDEYSRLYKQLSSSAQGQVDAAIASLRAIKAAEDAEIEAAQNVVTTFSNSTGHIWDLEVRFEKDSGA